MFETVSDMTQKQIVMDAPAKNYEAFSLPSIPKKPESRQSNHSKKELPLKQKLNLPSLYYSQIDPQTINGDKQNFQLKSKSAFARQVKQRLNFVLGEMPYVENGIIDDDQDSDDMDFQQRINKNRQLIKKQKLKRENSKNAIPVPNGNSKASKSKKQIKNRNQSSKEKRVKQYRQVSIQNKNVKLKKQNNKEHQNFLSESHIAQKNQKELKLRLKNENIQAKHDKSTSKKSQSKGLVRLLSQRSSQKNLNENAKQENLFDNIQNYLSNPHGKQKQNQKQLVGLALLKAKRDIEDKIKLIDQKLNLPSNQNLSVEKQQILKMTESIRDWRRIQIGQKKIICQKSNFDEQIDRIQALQEKNSQCIEKYVQYQKMLVDLQQRKKQKAKVNIKSH